MKKVWKYILYLLIAGVVGFILIQFVPYGRDHTNPPTTMEPKWDSPQTRQLAKDHCFQCHSNETDWTWYSNIAPASWLIYHDVVSARSNFNFSQWDTSPGYVGDLVAAVQENRMPPIQYWLFHPSSLLSGQQKEQFIQGLQNSLEK